MNTFECSIKAWGAWGPGVDTPETLSNWAEGKIDWGSEGKPDVSFLPPAARRRLSLQCKMILSALYRCLGTPLPADIPSVFASRYGENQLTTSILYDIAEDSLISPMDFSLSVHNSAAGIFSIQAKNRAPSLSMAAEEDTFGMGLLEAHSLLEQGHPEVLFITSDEPLCEVYQPYFSELQVPYALAMVLSKSEGDTVETGFSQIAPAQRNASQPPLALHFLKWLMGSTAETGIPGRNFQWSWKRA